MAQQRALAKQQRLQREAEERAARQAAAEAQNSSSLEGKAPQREEEEAGGGRGPGATVDDGNLAESMAVGDAAIMEPPSYGASPAAGGLAEDGNPPTVGGKNLPQPEQAAEASARVAFSTRGTRNGLPPPKQAQSTDPLHHVRPSSRLGSVSARADDRHATPLGGGFHTVYSSRSYAAAYAAAAAAGMAPGGMAPGGMAPGGMAPSARASVSASVSASEPASDAAGTARAYMDSYRSVGRRSARSYMDSTQRSASRVGGMSTDRSSSSPTGRFHPDVGERIMQRQLDPHANIDYYATVRNQGGRYGAPDNDCKMGTGGMIASQAFFESLL